MSEDIDTLRAQLAHVAQLLGSPTVSAEAAACIAVKRADELRERAETAESERDAALARCRYACQMLVEEIGAPGPIFVEDAAREAAKMIRELRERAEKAELWVYQVTHAMGDPHDGESRVEPGRREVEIVPVTPAEVVDALTRLARYEAQGPALLTAEHSDYCYSVVAPGDDNCSCTKAIIDAAYREQHARCVGSRWSGM